MENKYLKALEGSNYSGNKYLDAFMSIPEEKEEKKPEVKKPFEYTPTENVNWTALKDVVRNAPQLASDIFDRFASGATMGLSDKATQADNWLTEFDRVARTRNWLAEKPISKDENYIPPNKYVLAGAEFAGAVVPIGIAGKTIAKPIANKLIIIGSKYLPMKMAKYMPALANVLGWSAAGTAYEATSKVIQEGELPTAKELAHSGLMWGTLEAGIGTAIWSGKVALAVNRFAKEAGIKRRVALDIVMKLADKEGRPLAEVAKDKALYHELKKAVVEMPESKIGRPLATPKDYTGQGSRTPEPLKTTIYEGEIPLPEKEIPLRPDQRDILSKKRQISEEAGVTARELTPEQIIERNRIRTNEESLNAAQRQRNLQAELNKNLTGNKYLDSLEQEFPRDPSSSVPTDVSGLPAQVPKLVVTGKQSKVLNNYPNIKPEIETINPFKTTPNLSIDYTEAKKRPDGVWKLFFRGTKNEVFPGEQFKSASEAKSYFAVEKIKAMNLKPAVEELPEIPEFLKPESVEATSATVSPDIQAVLQKSTPISVKESVKTKAQAKETLMSKFEAGEISENTPVRLTTVDELRGMIEKGELYIGKDFEGRPGISAQTIQKESPIVAYGSNTKTSAAIIFPKESIEEIGEAVNEVKMNPRTDLNELRFVIGGHPELLTFEQIKNLHTGTPKKAALQPSGIGGVASPEAATRDFSVKEGLGQAERTVGDFVSDLNTALGKRGELGDAVLSEKQKAAMERVITDARKAGKEITAYMKDLGFTPEASANLLERYEKTGVAKNIPTKEVVTKIPKTEIESTGENIIDRYSKPKVEIVKKTMTALDNALGVVSTRLGNVAPELKDKIKIHAAEKAIRTKNAVDKITPFHKKFNKLSEKEQLKIHKLLDNGQYNPELRKQGLEILKEKGMLEEFLQVDKEVYKKLYREFIESGGKSNEISGNYISRHLRDYAGLRETLGKENLGKIDEAFAKEAAKRNITVDELSDEAKGAIIDSMMRGWSKNKIFLFDPFEVKTGIGKSRTLKILTEEQLSKYHPLHESMLKYAENMSNAIANNNLFKKSRTIGKVAKEQWFDDIDIPDKAGINNSIGDIINDIKKKKTITMEQEAEIKHVLTSYMLPKSQGKFITGIKNVTYNALLGNIETALTQFQDIGITTYKHGIRNTIQGLLRMPTKRAYRLGDIGTDNFKADLERNTKMGKSTKLNMVPLSLADMFGKGLNMNANLVKTQRALKNPKYKPEIVEEINRLFGDDAKQVTQDLLNGKKTFATNVFVHYNLAKHHPISTAEVPTGYLNSDKGRLLYMLHTYQIKQLDIARNDVLNEIKAGNIKKGAYNAASLVSWLVASYVGVNAAKDFVFKGDTKKLSEYITDSVWQLGLVNRYLFDKGFRHGVGTFLWEGIAPGTISIANDVSKDLMDIVKDEDEKGLRSTKFLPLLGRPYYDRFGRGYETSLERNSE